MIPELKQFFLFCTVGAVTTLLDFGIFNLLTRPIAGWRRIPANLVSVCCAMTWSFLANWLIVFHADGQDWLSRAGRFLLTTACSAFVLQNVVLYLTTYVWLGPTRLAGALVRALRLEATLDADFVSRNTCKTLAVASGLIWNFGWYKFFVYAP